MKDAVIEMPIPPGASFGKPVARFALQGIRDAYTDEPSCLPQSNLTFPRREDEVRVLQQKLSALCKANRKREAIAEALAFFDDRLIARRIRDCDRAFRQLQVTELAASVMVSILGITIRAKELKGRAIFFERVFQEIARVKGKRYAKELLAKYR